MLIEPDSFPENIILETVAEQNEQEVNSEPDFTFPPIAGFWRRFFAWLVDMLILGVTGQILGLIFSTFLFSLGPYGRPIELLFVVPYFGIMNSKIGGGQTIGKRLFKLSVRNQNNETIGLGRSIVRILILSIPVLLNQWSIPIFQNKIITWLVSLIVFGLGSVILYTMIFNRKARQGIHDLLLGTYVVHLPGDPIESFPNTSKIHKIVIWILVGLVTIGSLVMLVISPKLISKTSLASIANLYNILKEDPRFFSLSIMDNTARSSNGYSSHTLIVTGWIKGKMPDDHGLEVAKSLAKKVLENEPNINNYDGILIKITTAFDIGIASRSFTSSFSDSIDGWRETIYSSESPNGFIPSLMVIASVIQ